ncbi:hypothetical protein Fmac_012895 [Flemingia macrophylla]|uniref:Uncharacterized protein n=1 Tax=Flemingia macrophylla TaxID=520843 RepID=A0ABD1MRL0_9FABA
MEKRRKGKKGGNVKKEENEENVVALIRRVTDAARSFLWEKEQSLLPSQSLALETLISSLTQKPSLPPPQKEWWFRSLSDSRWLDAFRISRPSFARLLALLSPSLAPSFPHAAPDCVLAAALLRLAHAAPYSALARRFALSPSDACRAFFAVCKALASALPLPSPPPPPSPSPTASAL